MPDEAVRAIERAAETSTGVARAAFERRAGALHATERNDPVAAISAYRRALEVVPTDVEAADALADLLIEPKERREMALAFDRAVHAELAKANAPTEPLRKLRRAAIWRGDRDGEYAALAALATTGEATRPELQALGDRRQARLLVTATRSLARPLRQRSARSSSLQAGPRLFACSVPSFPRRKR